MKILVLQLKRIGDLVLTTPALVELRRHFPSAHITLAVADGCASLLPAIPAIDRGLVFRRRSLNIGFWKALLFTRFDICLDFTGNDRSALCCLLSGAGQRVGFEWMKSSRIRARVYNRFIDSAVRDHHTVDHYLHLLRGLECDIAEAATAPVLRLPAREIPASLPDSYAVIHPGTARVEKYWEPDRWAAVIAHLRERHGLECVITGGADAFERGHIAQIQAALSRPCLDLSGKLDLPAFAAVIEKARLCMSCDTAAVHLAAAFSTPQIALYGVTNPFHWQPRHARAVVISAAAPEGAIAGFKPRMKGAPMSVISTAGVLPATDALLVSLEEAPISRS